MGFADHVTRAARAVQGHLGGVPVIYRPQFSAAVEVVGKFDENAVLLDPGVEGGGVEQMAPAVFLQIEDLPIHPDEDNPEIEIAGLRYTVRRRQPDGAGGIRLFLHRAEA